MNNDETSDRQGKLVDNFDFTSIITVYKAKITKNL
jgi:hypothetical protein